MKNYKIKPKQIPHLLMVTADLFRNMVNEASGPNQHPHHKEIEKNKMYFMADLLNQMVETAYPNEEDSKEENIGNVIGNLNLKPINKAVFEDLDKQFEDLAEIMKNYKPPKAGEF